MKPIPIKAAKRIAKDYGYDQVIIVARKVGDDPKPHGEHVTTYGVNKAHCGVAASVGGFLKYKIMGWVRPLDYNPNAGRCPHCKTLDRGTHAFWCPNHDHRTGVALP